MADRMNIKFSIQAIDRFSKTMTNLERKLDSIQRKANSLDLSRRVDIDIDTAQATAQLSALQQQIDGLGGGNADIDVHVDSAGAIAELARIRAAAENMDSARIRAEVNDAVARAQLARLRAQRDNLGKKPGVINVIVGGYLQFRRNMDRIATTGRNVGEILSNTFMGVATTFGTTLVPIIASTTGAIGSLGVMIGTTGGATMGLLSAFVGAGAAAGGFAAVAIPVIGRLNEAVKEVKDSQEKYQTALRQGNEKQAAKYLAEYEFALSQMSGEQRKAMENMDKFKASFNEIANAAEPGVLAVYANALQFVTSILQQTRPMIDASVGAVQRLTEAMNVNIESADMQEFFNFLNTTGAASLEVISKALGNFLMGFLNMMVAFGPLATDMQGGFLRMSEGFRNWTAALGDNSKFQAFVNYVRTNWPAVRTIIGTAIAAIIETFAGFAGYATTWMGVTQDLINKWREFAQGMGENAKFQAFLAYITTNGPKVNALIGDLVGFLVALGVAMAPVGSKMLEVASAILTWLTGLLQANPEISKMIGFLIALAGGFFTLLPAIMAIFSGVSTLIGIFKLFGPTFAKIGATLARVIPGFSRLSSAFTTLRIVMMMIGGPVMWIIGILLLLVPVFMKLWQTSETFRNVMTTAWEAIKSAVTSAITAISTFIMSVWGSVVAWWTQNGEMIKQAATNVWNFISTVITTAMTVIAAIIKFVWPAVLMVITSVWNNIKGVISGAVNMIMGIVTIFAGLFTGNFSAMWEGVKQLFSGAIQFLWNAVQLLLWGKLIKGVMVFAGMFRTGIATMWTSVKTAFSSGITAVRTFFTNGLNAIKSAASNAWTHIYVRASDAMIRLRAAVSNGINAVKNFFVNAWTHIYVRTSDAMIRMRTAVSNGMNAIRNFFSNVLSAIRSRVTSAMSSVRSAFSNGMNAVRSVVTNVLNAVRNFFSSALSAIRSRVTSALASIRSAFSSGMNAARSVVMSALNAIKSTFMSAVSAIVSRVTSGLARMVAAFRSGLERAKSIVRGAINAIKALFNIDLSAQGAKIVASVARGITGAIGKVTGAIGKVTEKIRNFLPFSPAKEGALRDLDKLNFGGTMAKSITRQTGTVRRAMASVMEAARPNVDYAVDNAYATAGNGYSAMQANRARESRTIVEVPVYLNGREIAKASNDEQNRMNQREQARKTQFSRTGGTQ